MFIFLWNFEIQTDYPILTRIPDLVLINKKKRPCQQINFDIPVDHRVKMKERKKIDEYLDLARELKKLWNMKVTVIPIVVGVFGTFSKYLEKIGTGEQEIRGRIETIQTTALRSAIILRRILES